MNRGTPEQVRQHIDAAPEVVYDLLADVPRMGEWSPECVGCDWIDGANGPVVGARFRGRNRHGLARWSTKSRVTAANRPSEFAFVASDGFGRDLTIWSYRLQPAGSGTELTESFELLRDIPWYIRAWRRSFMGVKDRKADLEENMGRTLSNIKSAAEGAGRTL